MTAPEAILADLYAPGIVLRIATDGVNLAAPAGRLSAGQRALVLEHKADLLAFLQAAQKTTAGLIDAAMRACDFYGDDEQAREQMRAGCLATPPHLQHDLHAHFQAYKDKQ